jgi:protein gp37
MKCTAAQMADLFGDWVPDEWISEVLEACKEAPQHAYLFLTKNPSRYMELARKGILPEEPNFWYGSTITGPEDSFWWSDYHNTFVSMEPLLQPFEGVGAQAVKKVGWCIIGAMTGPGSKAHQPKREWVESIATDAKTAGVPVFMKDNLKGVWGDQLLRECPEGIDLADKKAVAEWDGE